MQLGPANNGNRGLVRVRVWVRIIFLTYNKKFASKCIIKCSNYWCVCSDLSGWSCDSVEVAPSGHSNARDSGFETRTDQFSQIMKISIFFFEFI